MNEFQSHQLRVPYMQDHKKLHPYLRIRIPQDAFRVNQFLRVLVLIRARGFHLSQTTLQYQDVLDHLRTHVLLPEFRVALE